MKKYIQIQTEGSPKSVFAFQKCQGHESPENAQRPSVHKGTQK